MQVHRTDELARFDAAARQFIEADPVRNTVLLTVLDTLRAGGGYDDADPWFAWTREDGETVAAALCTPPYKVAVSGLSAEAAMTMGRELTSYDLPGAFGDLATVAAFADGAGRRHTVGIHEIQYVLTELSPPLPVPGVARAYADVDADLYVRWESAFAVEVGVMRSADPLRSLQQRIAGGGGLWLWDVDGQPVSMCGRTPVVCGVPRIGPVWTPLEHRRRGYAAAVTASVCRDALRAGARACTLFADAANPTSNGIYTRLGFRPAAETVEASFERR